MDNDHETLRDNMVDNNDAKHRYTVCVLDNNCSGNLPFFPLRRGTREALVAAAASLPLRTLFRPKTAIDHVRPAPCKKTRGRIEWIMKKIENTDDIERTKYVLYFTNDVVVKQGVNRICSTERGNAMIVVHMTKTEIGDIIFQ